MRAGPEIRQRAQKLMLLNSGVEEYSWESLGLQGDQTSQPRKGNLPWTLIGRTDAEGEAPILSPADVNSQLIGKDFDARKDWRQKEMRVTKDQMVGWHHWFSGHELGQTPWYGEEQGGLACCHPWGCEESDTAWQLNNNPQNSPLKYVTLSPFSKEEMEVYRVISN